MSALHAARVTLNSPRLLGAAAVAALAETTLRVALGWLVSPVLAVLFPPIAAVVAIGTVAPHVRRMLAADGAAGGHAGNRPRLPALAGVATAGHAAAVAGGTALFLLVDTPIRAALYWLGRGDLLGTAVQLLAPLAGVATGTLLAWAVVATAAVDVVDGASVRQAFVGTPGRVVEAPRSVGVTAGLHLALATSVLGAVGLGFRYLLGYRSVAVFVAVGGGLGVLVASFGLAFLAAFHFARVAIVGLLVAGLVAGAGAVRAAELRPVDRSPDPLPDDPDGLYATAVENTERADHRYRVVIGPDRSEPFVIEHRIDRDDRQYRQRPAGEAVGPSVYASTGTGSPPMKRGTAILALGSREVGPGGDRTVRAFPDYLLWVDAYEWDGDGGLAPPATGVEGWEVTDRGDGRVVLELDDPATVFAATQGRTPRASRT